MITFNSIAEAISYLRDKVKIPDEKVNSLREKIAYYNAGEMRLAELQKEINELDCPFFSAAIRKDRTAISLDTDNNTLVKRLVTSWALLNLPTKNVTLDNSLFEFTTSAGFASPYMGGFSDKKKNKKSK